MTNIKDYWDKISKIEFSTFPEALMKGHEYLLKVTSNGENWNIYNSSEPIKKTIDLYLAKFDEYYSNLQKGKVVSNAKKDSTPKSTKEKKKKVEKKMIGKQTYDYVNMSTNDLERAYEDIMDEIDKKGQTKDSKARMEAMYIELTKRGEKTGLLYPSLTPKQRLKNKISELKNKTADELLDILQNLHDEEAMEELDPLQRMYKEAVEKELSKKDKAKEQQEVTLVERIPEELRFIKRFVNMDGKWKTKDEILRFINSLQKAILEKRIRKISNWADQIEFIQGKLIDVYNSMKQKIKIELKEETKVQFRLISTEEKVMPSINFIKRYISMNGKPGMREKAKKLLEQINRAMDKGKIGDSDTYISEIHTIKKNLKSFATTKVQKTLEIEKTELNGLEGILGCACQQLNGLDELPPVMNSMDFANIEFDTIGLRGKWHDLIGDPSRNFTAMVFGKPKMGKSYLCIEFAGYLARHHGKVLYVAKEEGLDMTLQKKLNERNVKHPNLYVASLLPADVSKYDFIFLDSVNRLGLKPEDLNNLKVRNPAKSFVFIFQSTKMGDFRGANSFQHDVDVVIEVPERGKAVQMGRFNQGGEMEIFEDGNWKIAA